MSSTRSTKPRRSTGSPSSGATYSRTKSLTTTIGAPSQNSMSLSEKRLTVCVAILAAASAFFASCPSAYAQRIALETIPTSETEPEVTFLDKGDIAPFAGDLYPVGDSIRIALEVEGCAERARIDLDHAREIHQIEIARVQSLAEAAAVADRERVRLLSAEIDANRGWYRSPPFVAAVAVVSTVAVLYTAALLVQSTGEVWR